MCVQTTTCMFYALLLFGMLCLFAYRMMLVSICSVWVSAFFKLASVSSVNLIHYDLL